jgi:hypothetical protein
LVIFVRDLYITSTLHFTGNRIPVLVVHGDASITAAGVIDVGASGTQPGPGGHFQCNGAAGTPGTHNQVCGGGGGGGGNVQPGGNGGGVFAYDTTSVGRGVAGGAALPITDVLRGGCPGGSGNQDSLLTVGLAAPGAGGGAIQLSVAGRLDVNGAIIADGSGGAGGSSGNRGGGGGGGSGGMVYLETSTLDGFISLANVVGGGGGGGADSTTSGSPGFSGRSGGAGGGGALGRLGGRGGDNQTSAGHGTDGTTLYTVGGGGGGGGYGRIVTTQLPAP